MGGDGHAGVRAGRIRQDDAADASGSHDHETPTGPSVAWVSLDERDNDPATFWTYVITALQRADRQRSRRPPRSGCWPPQPPPEAALATLLNDLAGAAARRAARPRRLPRHRGAARSTTGLSYLLDHLPPHVHLVLATRADPPLPLSRLRARGELVEVRSADLRFTRDEAADYLAGPMGLTLTAGRRRARSPTAPKAGLPRCSWPACRCRTATTPARSSPGSPATTASSSTTSPTRSWRARAMTYATSCSRPRPRPPHRPAVRRRHRPLRRRGAAGRARAGQPFPRPARRPPAVVALPPPVRRRPSRPPRSSSIPDRVAELHRRAADWLQAQRRRVRRRSAMRWRATTSRAPRISWSWRCR